MTGSVELGNGSVVYIFEKMYLQPIETIYKSFEGIKNKNEIDLLFYYTASIFFFILALIAF